MVLRSRGRGRVGRRQPSLRSPAEHPLGGASRCPPGPISYSGSVALSVTPVTERPHHQPMATRCGHIALAGAPNVGKSTLLNALVGQHLAIVSPKPQATRLPVVGLRTEADTQYVFYDLPGLLDPAYQLQASMVAAAQERLAAADLALQLHPAAQAPAPPLQQLARLEHPPRAPVLIVYTQADLAPPERVAELGPEPIVVS